MKFHLFVLIFFISHIGHAQQKSQTNIDTIYWQPDYKLTAEDFRGTAEMQSRFGAISFIGLSYSCTYEDDSISFEINCYFVKKSSWINPHSLNNNLLDHEQGHFNIGEIFKNELLKYFRKYKPQKGRISSDLRDIYLKIKSRMNAVNEAYDNACAFPPNPSQQKIWNEKIRSSLVNGADLLEAPANPVIQTLPLRKKTKRR